jgi:hypothetical protein
MKDNEKKPQDNKSEIIKIYFSELPEDLLNRIALEIGFYSVQLFSVTDPYTPEEKAIPFGSGTLITFKSQYYIITAGHVIKSDFFSISDYIGVNISKNTNAFKIKASDLYKGYLWNKSQKLTGPDLGLITIPPDKIGLIMATKNFWNIDKMKEKILDRKFQNFGFWAVCGAPIEKSTSKYLERGYKEIITQHMGPWISGEVEETTHENYDYIEVIFNEDDTPEWPSDFAGLSGGGLWQIPIAKDINSGEYTYDIALFSGTVFAEKYNNSWVEKIRCHGRKSIYTSLDEIVNKLT